MAISFSNFTSSLCYVTDNMNSVVKSPCTAKVAQLNKFKAAAAGGHCKETGSRFAASEAIPKDDPRRVDATSGSAIVKKPLLSEVPEEEKQRIKKWIVEIKTMFRNMKDGEISVSAYDTSWVARVPSLHDSTKPQFPNSLEWIMNNQLPDGSWGHKDIFLAYDRICNTVGCLVALKTWDLGHHNIIRGLKFVWSNIAKIEKEGTVHMPIGFEIIFTALLEDAKEIGIDLPYTAPILEMIQHEGQKKMKSIPLDILHNYPTTLLHSLEGLHRLVDWNKLLSLQEENGSFFMSPSSTACALKYTGDEKCLQYLTYVLEKFRNAVPNVYPVDLFERLWIVDRLQRLGISRYFETELKECLDYVYRYWGPNGISWARKAVVQDINYTAMGFLLFRLNGYDVSPDVFTQFYKNDELFCFAHQTSQAVTGMFNFYRATQTLFPGEELLQKGRTFSHKFLEMKQKQGTVFDKWLIAKGLKGEVEYALSFPWYANLPRIETSEYLSQYGPDDIWIGRVLYKMPYVNNHTFLNLAKADFNLCQLIHQQELKEVLRWNKDCEFDKLCSNVHRQKAVECYFAIAATMFEPELASLRFVWTRCSVLTTVIDDFCDGATCPQEVEAFMEAVKRWDNAPVRGCSNSTRILFRGLYNTVNSISEEANLVQGRDVSSYLRNLWVRMMAAMLKEAEWRWCGYMPCAEEYMETAAPSFALEPIVLSCVFFAGAKLTDEILNDEDSRHMMDLVNVIGRLLNDIQGFQRETESSKYSSINIYMRDNPGRREENAIKHLKSIIDQSTQELVREVVRATALPRQCKRVHLSMSNILHLFYLNTDGYTSPTEMKGHVDKILFSPVA